jgi:hypothetical protein
MYRAACPLVAGWVPGHGDDVVTSFMQGYAQALADKAGRAGYQDFHMARLPGRPGSYTGVRNNDLLPGGGLIL